MPAPRMISVAHTPRERALPLAFGSFFALACAITSASEILVVTDRQHPVSTAPDVRVIELDAPERLIESALGARLPGDPGIATTMAKQRLQDGGTVLQRRFALAYQDIIEAWSLGITKTPAVVVDRRYVVYGVQDVERAASLVERYRSTQP